MSEIVTRFAPSPTGYLHIGGARTALFNWLFSRGHGGKFLLRIEDTDRERSTEENVAAIINGLTWLGLDWDGEPFFQSKHHARHTEVVEQLLADGHAYRCYASPEELQEMRNQARAEGRPMRYDRRWRDRLESCAPDGVAPAIRIKAPTEGETVIEDAVQGTVRVPNDQLDDLVLMRSDGTPTYMLSVVADDHDMGITHVIRGDDHLTNAFRQKVIYDALGWPTPVFAHIPLIHGPDGAKLSKRHGSLGVEAYHEMGYLPEAMRNYLSRLGWGHGDAEIFSSEEAQQWFTLEGIGRSPARFDFKKLESLNGHYIRHADAAHLAAAVRPFLETELGRELTPEDDEILLAAMPGLKERARTLVDLAHSAVFFFRGRPLELDEKAAKILDSDARQMLGRLVVGLEGSDDWSVLGLEEQVKKFAEACGLKLGQVAQPMRAALSGTTVSPGIFDVLVVLGREESLARLKDQAAS